MGESIGRLARKSQSGNDKDSADRVEAWLCEVRLPVSLKSDRESARGGIYEPWVQFDWAVIIPSHKIIVRHSSDPLHDTISHFLLSVSHLACIFSADLWSSAKSPPAHNTCSSVGWWYEPLAGAEQVRHLLREEHSGYRDSASVLPRAAWYHSAPIQTRGGRVRQWAPQTTARNKRRASLKVHIIHLMIKFHMIAFLNI